MLDSLASMLLLQSTDFRMYSNKKCCQFFWTSSLDAWLSILFWQSSSCCDSTAVSKEGRIFFAAYPTVDFRRSCEVNWTVRLVQVARRMLLPETFTNLISLQFASTKLASNVVYRKMLPLTIFIRNLSRFKIATLVAQKNSWYVSCSLPHVQSECPKTVEMVIIWFAWNLKLFSWKWLEHQDSL